jgi:hypothetical protein
MLLLALFVKDTEFSCPISFPFLQELRLDKNPITQHDALNPAVNFLLFLLSPKL